MLHGVSKLIQSNPQCSLASSRRPHPLGIVPRGPLTHPPFAAAGGFRLGEHNPCYRKLLCAIVVGTGFRAGSGGGGLPGALSSCGADCPLVAVMRAFFFITRPLAFSLAWRPPLARFLRSTNRANSTLSAFGTNRRPPLSLFQCTFFSHKPSPPRAPAHPLSVNKKSDGA